VTKSEVPEVLLVEAHRILNEEAKRAVQKIGKSVPQEARPGYLTDDEVSILKEVDVADVDHPLMRKYIRASAARSGILSYPPEEVLSSGELEALEGLKLSPAAFTAVQRVIADAYASTLFHFLCLMDSAADPELVRVEHWSGADFVSPREEGNFLHDEFLEK
jgi:hypothetical protein